MSGPRNRMNSYVVVDGGICGPSNRRPSVPCDRTGDGGGGDGNAKTVTDSQVVTKGRRMAQTDSGRRRRGGGGWVGKLDPATAKMPVPLPLVYFQNTASHLDHPSGPAKTAARTVLKGHSRVDGVDAKQRACKRDETRTWLSGSRGADRHPTPPQRSPNPANGSALCRRRQPRECSRGSNPAAIHH